MVLVSVNAALDSCVSFFFDFFFEFFDVGGGFINFLFDILGCSDAAILPFIHGFWLIVYVREVFLLFSL